MLVSYTFPFDSAIRATVRVCGADGMRVGQGLCVQDDTNGSLILTCYHVIAALTNKDTIRLDLFSEGDEWLRTVDAAYCDTRSDPSADVAVLTANEKLVVHPPRLMPLPSSYRNQERIVGIVRPDGTSSHRFNARLAESTRIEAEVAGLPIVIPRAWRLIDATDIREGISGAPIVLNDSVIGLVHFSRRETADYTREAYVVPIEAWFQDNAALRLFAGEYETLRATPSLPPHFVPREDSVEQLFRALTTGETSHGIGTIAIYGMAGIGKTTIAQAFCDDARVRQAFPDGIVWLTIGKEPAHDVRTQLREVGKLLGDDLAKYDSELGAIHRYKSAIRDRRALVVLDDVWSVSDLEPFRASSRHSRLLFTTRDDAVATSVSAKVIQPTFLSVYESRHLLAAWADVESAMLPAEADSIARECGGLPLAVSIAGAMLRGKPPTHWSYVLHLLGTAELEKIRQAFPGYPYQTLLRSLQVSVDELDEETQRRYFALAVTLEGATIDPTIQRVLWDTNEFSALETADILVGRALAQRTRNGTGIQIHDLLLDYIRYGYPNQAALPVVLAAMRLSSHIVEREPAEFVTQLAGRLVAHAAEPAVATFIGALCRAAPRPWLRPMNVVLQPPKTGLVRTYENDRDEITALAVTADGSRAVVGSRGQVLRVWDLARGTCEHLLEGHFGAISDIAVTADGSRAISASSDGSLRTWDIVDGRAIAVLVGHASAVYGVAIAADGSLAVSASQDRTIGVWDVSAAKLIHRFGGEGDVMSALTLVSQQSCAVVGSWDGTVRIWDLASGESTPMQGTHDGWVQAVAASADGCRVVSGSTDSTLRLWNAADGALLRTLRGHDDAINAVAMTADGRRAITASDDSTLKIWDLESGSCIETLTGHSGPVSGVALVANSDHIVSASADGMIKVWEIGKAVTVAPLTQRGAIRAITVSLDGSRALTASEDHSVVVWDVSSGKAVATFRQHVAAVGAIAVSPDGRVAASASDDGTTHIWDIESGSLYRSLRSRTIISALALTNDGTLASASRHPALVASTEPGSNGGFFLTFVIQLSYRGEVTGLRELAGHRARIDCIAVLGDCEHIVSVSTDHSAFLWDIREGVVRSRFPAHAVTLDGSRSIEIANGAVVVRDVLARSRLETHSGFRGSTTRLAVSPSAQRTVCVRDESILEAWDAHSPFQLARVSCDAALTCCAFANERTILAGDCAGRVYFLSLES